MKIRLEKVEIEIPREFVETINAGFLRLAGFEAEANRVDTNSRNNTLAQIAMAGLAMMRQAWSEMSKTNREPPAAPAHTTGDDNGESSDA